MLYGGLWKRQFNKEVVTMRLNNSTSRLRISLLVPALLCTLAEGKTIYVDDDSPSDFSTIRAAIDDANGGDTVLVAPGTYTGDGNHDIDFKGKAITVRSADPNDPAIIASTIIDCQDQGRGFIFESGEQADSILEGITITNGRAEYGGGILIRNSSPTVSRCTISYCSEVHPSYLAGGGICIFNGDPLITDCTIRNNAVFFDGAGIYCDGGSPMVVNSIIENNQAGWGDGSGIYYKGSGRPSIINCTIRSNSANPIESSDRTIRTNAISRGGDGGGIFIYGGQPIVSQCSIIENTGGRGGGLFIRESSPLISHCSIENNLAASSGGLYLGGMGWSDAYTIRVEHCRISGNSANTTGGLSIRLCTLYMYNCVISDNSSLYGVTGGGLDIHGLTIAEIDQCTIVGNKVVEDPPGVRCVGGGLFIQRSDVKIANSIIRWNRATKGAQLAIHAWDGQQRPDEPPKNDPTLVTLHHSDFSSEQDQEVYIYGEPNLLTLDMYDNLDVDPCFADSGRWDPNSTPDDPNDDFWDDGDYHLKSEYGRWNPNTQTWVVDDVTSPCIDGGDPNMPVGDEPFPNGVIINMGAYGGTTEASKSISDIPLTVNVNDNDNGGQVTLRLGQILAVTLESNPTTGYSWSPVEKQDSILEKFGDSLYFPSEQDDGTVGAGGWEILYFKSINIGQETLELVYRRSWETDVEPIKTFSINVVVN
jgi:parallel beta-helix repeat protein